MPLMLYCASIGQNLAYPPPPAWTSSNSFKDTERKIQERWSAHDCFTVDDNAPGEKYYSLCMWPYPSGDLHVGHLRNYALGDVWARHKRMQGYNVLQPMGWDAFGKDAELKAHKVGIHPSQWVRQNTTNMRRELKELGFMIDWSRELNVSNPAYYRWETAFVRAHVAPGDWSITSRPRCCGTRPPTPSPRAATSTTAKSRRRTWKSGPCPPI